jgi:hypothetical protein
MSRPETVKTSDILESLLRQAKCLHDDAVTASLGYVRTRRHSKTQLSRQLERLRGATHLAAALLGGLPEPQRQEIFDAIYAAESVLRKKGA